MVNLADLARGAVDDHEYVAAELSGVTGDVKFVLSFRNMSRLYPWVPVIRCSTFGYLNRPLLADMWSVSHARRLLASPNFSQTDVRVRGRPALG
jgi:hypothetical protein